MKYYLTITKKEENPNYEAEKERWEEENRFNRMNRFDDPLMPQSEITTNALNVILTEEQFKAIRKEVMAKFE